MKRFLGSIGKFNIIVFLVYALTWIIVFANVGVVSVALWTAIKLVIPYIGAIPLLWGLIGLIKYRKMPLATFKSSVKFQCACPMVLYVATYQSKSFSTYRESNTAG